MLKLREHIQSLEETLLHTDHQANTEIINDLVREDFEEIGPLGKVISRENMIGWLKGKDNQNHWTLHNFHLKELSSKLMLATYKATRDGSASLGSMRSSIWSHQGNQWQMVFHHATNIVSE